MNPNATRRVPAVLDVILFSAPWGALDWVRCLLCSGPLNLMQPDNDCPERLVGVCEVCGRWALIEMAAGDSDAVMILLPEAGWLQSLPSGRDPVAFPDRPDPTGQRLLTDGQ